METTTNKVATRAEASLVETGEKRDGRGRKLCQVDHRTDFVRMYRTSGLTMAAFARREGLKYSTLAGWVIKHGAKSVCPAPIRFSEVQMPLSVPAPAFPRLEVSLVDGTLVRGTNVKELAALVQALRS
jgi:glutamine phosphoribosylpyrophosphate amidotransferase